jgi:TPR repeat protein
MPARTQRGAARALPALLLLSSCLAATRAAPPGSTSHGADVQQLEAGCGGGDPAACTTLGAIYRDRGDAKALERAAEVLTRACDLKSGEGCALLGVLNEAYERHDARPVLEAYRRSCELGYAKGCELYGFAQRRQAPGDRHAGEDSFIRACGLGDLPSCHGLGRARIDDPATRADGITYLRKACRGDFAPSCLAGAELFAPVVGKAASSVQALPFAEGACAKKEEVACAIADACRIEADPEATGAMQRLRAACDDGISLACFYWANATEGSAANSESVNRAYALACQRNSAAQPLACTRVAVMKLASATTAAEAEPLTQFLQTACERSVGEACCARCRSLCGRPLVGCRRAQGPRHARESLQSWSAEMLPALSRHSGRRKAAATRAKARCGPVSDGICCPASTRPSGASEPRWRRRLLRNFRELKLSGREDLNLRPFGPELTVAASQPGARRLADGRPSAE